MNRPHLSCSEYAMVVASRLYFSAFYRTVYLLMIASSIACVAWTILNHWRTPTSKLFISLEILLCSMLVVEVLIRMLALKRKFWTRWSNLFDVAATILSIVSVALYFQQEGVVEELEEVAADFIMMFRNANQYMRLAVFLKNRKLLVTQKTADSNGIDFDDLDEGAVNHSLSSSHALQHAEQSNTLLTLENDTDDDDDAVVLTSELEEIPVAPIEVAGTYDDIALST
ncbi:hypothetical protein LEN26_001590 [Aphanomyces euteiches]|nr:hypothetical protein AeMF1_015533 [Aphanomyces euteiches]KAH9135704.1 hypothetical protein AeRB84_018964 [Aphanomyces euteiches]KAH9161076.1 hypothetical protein LEN26_001590 [Aphanomyces euteiches]KAH9189949.1 hypothetical protein AeNC1_008074 [Aphanomyces euteiches]